MKEILLVDDNIEILDIYQQILEEEFSDLKIQRFESAFEAIQYLKVKKPILIVCDYYMPKLNGSAVVSYNQLNTRCPIIICSSGLREEYQDLNDFEKDHSLNQYVKKPFEINYLIEIVKLAQTQTKT